MKNKILKKLIVLLVVLSLTVSGSMFTAGAQTTVSDNEYPSSLNAPEQSDADAKQTLTALTSEKSADSDNDFYRAVWISYLEYQSILKRKTEEQFTQSIEKMLDNCVEMGLNTVIVQARAKGDAYYPSEVYPWGEEASGTAGKAIDFDPLGIIVDACKERGLEVHAWINPYRLTTDANMKKIDDSYQIKKWYNSKNRSDYMLLLDGTWWLNPAKVEVRKLVYSGVKEIVENYDVDGIHLDDYFYPPTTYTKFGHTFSVARASNTKLIKGIRTTIHSVDDTVKLGISPLGGIDSSLKPASDTSKYTNIKYWVSRDDYIDYIMPQVYWGFEHQTAKFDVIVERWEKLVNTDYVDLVIGLAPYKSGTQDKYAGTGKNEWINNDDIIARQVEYINEQPDLSGFCLFRYDHVLSDNLKGNMKQEARNLEDLLASGEIR